MATGNVVLTVVDVGQGQCTFVEIYNTSGVLTNTLLFDCGSDKTSDETKTNLDYIVAQASKLTNPVIDCIFFSHSDKDHISLTRYVLDEINKTKTPYVGEVIYGGELKNYTKYNFNIINYIDKMKWCSSSKIFSLKSNKSDYNKTQKKYTSKLWENSDSSVVVYAIAANVLSDDPDWDDDDFWESLTAEEKNRVSLVCGLYYGTSCFVICGDATSKTMAAISEHFKGTTVFNNNKMTTLPHHGSRATGFAVSSAYQASDNAIKVVDDFASLMKSKVLTVSAFAKHRHPSLELMNRFIPTVNTPVLKDTRLNKPNSHFITANIDIKVEVSSTSGKKRARSWYVPTGTDSSFESKSNMFSTRYYTTTGKQFGYELGDGSAGQEPLGDSGSINGFACWQFTTASSSGTTSLAGYENLGTSTAFTSAPNAFVASGPAVIPDEDEPPLLTEQQPVPVPLQREPAKIRKPALPKAINSKLKQFH